MAVTLFHKRKVINNIVIINGRRDEDKPNEKAPEKRVFEEYNAKIRGKTYGRRTINSK